MNVAPHAGAWIETKWWPFGRYLVDVAPHAGAWIETSVVTRMRPCRVGRTPRGCVD